MAERLQWTVQCRGCNSSVEYNCNTCNSALCSDCKNKHKVSEEGRHHMIVQYSKRVLPTSRECKEHPVNTLVAWCDTCGKAVCVACVTSPCHERHLIKDFQCKVKQRKSHLQEQYEETKSLCLMWQQSLTNLVAEDMATNTSFENEQSEVKEQANALHDKINNVKDDVLKELQRHNKSCQHKMNEQKDKIQSRLQTLEQKRNEYEKILRSKDAVTILEFNSSQGEREKNTSPPRFNELQIPSFKKGEYSQTQLCELFGRLALEEENTSTDYEDPERMTIKELKMNSGLVIVLPVPAEITKDLDRSSCIPSASNLLAETHIIQTSYKDAAPIVCIGTGLAWIGTERKKLKLLDKAFNVSHRKLFQLTFCDLALDSKEQLVVLTSNRDVKCVSRFSSDGKLHLLFKLDRKPYGFCILMNDNVLITFREEKKVIVYSQTGEKFMNLDGAVRGYPLFSIQNKVNRHIYITDKDGRGQYDSPGRIAAVKENGEFLYEYTGQKDTIFTPVDMCSDRNGQVFITDYLGRRVHILNKDGTFMRFLPTHGFELINPCRIDINDSKFVWISENETEKVKVVGLI